MKQLAQFSQFMRDVVNLNQTRITLLEDSIEAIKKVVCESEWRPKIRGFAAQGSWAHKTIIRPQSGDPFDADLLVYVDSVEDWTAATYVDTLYDAFNALGTYKDKVRRFSHCVTIEYAGDRKIDITPCIKERESTGTWEVCNRVTDAFERSNPLDYTTWVSDHNSVIGGNDLTKTTRLLKFLRDVKLTFTCPSFLLTTLLGMQVRADDADSSDFVDLPTTLKTIVGRLDDWLQARPFLPTVRNPVLYEEVQSAVWDDEKYANFRDKIHRYRDWIDDAFDEANKDESITKWRRIFGDDFGKVESTEKAAPIDEVVAKAFPDPALAGHGGDLVDRVIAQGVVALPHDFLPLAHMRAPSWRPGSNRYRVNVSAQLYRSRYGPYLRTLASLSPVAPGDAIRFAATNAQGVPFPVDFRVVWRVSNTDRAAEEAGQLRGDFYKSDEVAWRWETTRFRGVHVVEAFLVDKGIDLLYGQSDPFFVVVL